MLWNCLSRVVDTGSSGISVESCTRSQNQGIPGQPGAVTMIRQCLITQALELETRRQGVCGSDEWQTGPSEE